MAKLLKGQFVAETEEAPSLLQSGFGKNSQDGVILHPLEAAYLCELSLLEINDSKKKMNVSEILKKFKTTSSSKSAGKLPNAKEQFELYSQLRSGGRMVRFNLHSPQYWRVYAKGVGREQERAQVLLRLITSDWKSSVVSLNREISVARQLRMELVLAFMEKGQPAFVKVNKFNLD